MFQFYCVETSEKKITFLKWKLKSKNIKYMYKTPTVLVPVLHFNGPCHCSLKQQTTDVHFFETRRDLTFQSRNIVKELSD